MSKSKHAIFQFYVPSNDIGKLRHYRGVDEMPEWCKRSILYFQHYAKAHDADHFFMEDRFVGSISNYFEKCRVYLDPIFDDYDKVLYVDIDVIPKNMDNNIFNIDPQDVAGVEEQPHPAYRNKKLNWTVKDIERRFNAFGAPVVRANHNNSWPRMINSGVMLWSREARMKARHCFDNYDDWFQFKNSILDESVKGWGHSSHCLDQPFFNAMFNKYKFNVNTLPIDWNRFPTDDENYPCNFAHYTQETRYNIPERFPEL